MHIALILDVGAALLVCLKVVSKLTQPFEFVVAFNPYFAEACQNIAGVHVHDNKGAEGSSDVVGQLATHQFYNKADVGRVLISVVFERFLPFVDVQVRLLGPVFLRHGKNNLARPIFDPLDARQGWVFIH